tara:strand:- start:155 stop:928 length:774 start_codon:yes stop_codon:yes gene_type:complete
MNNDISNLAIVTYTNSNCEDIWPVYFGQIDKFGNKIKSYAFSDKNPEKVTVSNNHNFVIYDNNEPYYSQYNECLKSVSEDYVVYCQEDFLLTDNIDYGEIERCIKVLSSTDYSFVRLVRTDIGAWKHYKQCRKRNWEKIELDKNIFCAHSTDFDAFSFQMQATIWKKKDIIKLYDHVRSQKWLENRDWDKGVRDTDTKGAYYYKDSEQEGPYHWAPEIWPHVCTAVGRGKWSLSLHGERLLDILNEYDIDPRTRGVR